MGSASDPLTRSCYSTLEVFAQEAFAHDALAQEAELQEALDQDAELQEALDQDAELQEALDQEAEFHEAFDCAASYQLLALNDATPPAVVTNWLRPAFGFAVPGAATAAEPLTAPTPSAPVEL